jgi:hypothetical protein
MGKRSREIIAGWDLQQTVEGILAALQHTTIKGKREISLAPVSVNKD